MLIVEDGTLTPNTNSYCDLKFIRNYCNARNLDLPADDDLLGKIAVLAMNYIESKKDKYSGHIITVDQTLSFPRKCAVVSGYYLNPTAIPVALKNAQAHAAYLISDDVELQPFVDGSFLSEAKVASLSVKFSQNTTKSVDGENYFTPVDDYLKTLMRKNYGYRLTTRHGY